MHRARYQACFRRAVYRLHNSEEYVEQGGAHGSNRRLPFDMEHDPLPPPLEPEWNVAWYRESGQRLLVGEAVFHETQVTIIVQGSNLENEKVKLGEGRA